MRRIFLFALAFVFVPFAVEAKTQTIWNFTDQSELSKWQGEGIGAFNQTGNGLILQTNAKAHMTRGVSVEHPIEEVRLRYRSEKRIGAKLLWHVRGTQERTLVELPFVLERSPNSAEVLMDVQSYREWDPRTDRLGILLPPSVKVELQEIELVKYSLVEKFVMGLQSLITFDTYRASVPNFLWGPHIATTQAGVTNLFANTPPRSPSVNFYLYILLGLLLAWFLVKIRRKILKPHLGTVGFLLCLGTVWIAYDLRMGAEVISYAWQDAATYWLQEPGKRTFRERQDYNDFVAQIAPRLEKHDFYALVVPQEQPLAAIMRYASYPALPVRIQEADARVTAGAFYREPGVELTELQQLIKNGVLLSAPGTVTYRSAPHTFLFEVTQ